MCNPDANSDTTSHANSEPDYSNTNSRGHSGTSKEPAYLQFTTAMILRQILALMFVCSCYGGPILLQWDPSPPEQGVIAYKVYYVKGNCAQMIAAVSVSTTKIVLNWTLQDYASAFYVTALNQNGDSFPSNYVPTK
jgi:hypothetical protein